jgi:hypothetical protein
VKSWKPPKCESGKALFRSQGEALRALVAIEKDNAQAVAPLSFQPHRAYHCDCGAWHLTKQKVRVAA